MPRSLDTLRKALQRHALKPTGIASYLERTFSSQVEAQTVEAHIMALPIDTSYQRPLQADDGTVWFMFGVSGFGQSPFGGGD